MHCLQQSQDSGSESQLNTFSLKEALERFDHSRTPSASSRSSRKSSHTAVSDPACKYKHLFTTEQSLMYINYFFFILLSEHHVYICPSASQMKLQGDRSTPGRQSVSAVEMTSQRRSSISSQVSGWTSAHALVLNFTIPVFWVMRDFIRT